MVLWRVVDTPIHSISWKKVKVDKDNLNKPDDGIQINQNGIQIKTDEVEEDDDETIVILTEHQGLKTRLKDNKTF